MLSMFYRKCTSCMPRKWVKIEYFVAGGLNILCHQIVKQYQGFFLRQKALTVKVFLRD